MEIIEYKNMYRHEKDHFFYVATHQLVLTLIDIFAKKTTRPLAILDAGCGTGLLAQKMQKLGKVSGIDLSPEALTFAKKRKIDVQKASIEKLPFKKNVFDVVVSIDVLTSASIKNDLIPLAEFYRVLKPGGILILRVSANRWLRLVHDKHVHMNHRYEKKELRTKLKQTGFKLEKLSFVHSLLFPPIVVRHFWEKLIKPKGTKSAVGKAHPIINSLLVQVLLLEVKLLTKLTMPFGLGLISVGRKPTTKKRDEHF